MAMNAQAPQAKEVWMDDDGILYARFDLDEMKDLVLSIDPQAIVQLHQIRPGRKRWEFLGKGCIIDDWGNIDWNTEPLDDIRFDDERIMPIVWQAVFGTTIGKYWIDYICEYEGDY